jgi:uncharacterized protein (TIGR00369 family)
MRHFEEHREERFGIARFLDYDLERVEAGNVVFRYAPKPDHLNLFSTIHGGVLASLLDTVMGCALMTMLEVGEQHTIIDLHTKFLRPVILDSEPLQVCGLVDHRGKRQCTMSGKIITADDKLCTTAIATAMIL